MQVQLLQGGWKEGSGAPPSLAAGTTQPPAPSTHNLSFSTPEVQEEEAGTVIRGHLQLLKGLSKQHSSSCTGLRRPQCEALVDVHRKAAGPAIPRAGCGGKRGQRGHRHSWPLRDHEPHSRPSSVMPQMGLEYCSGRGAHCLVDHLYIYPAWSCPHPQIQKNGLTEKLYPTSSPTSRSRKGSLNSVVFGRPTPSLPIKVIRRSTKHGP